MTAASFLNHLYAYTDTGWLTLFSVDRTTGEKPTRWTEIGETDAAAQQAAELATTGCVWFGVAPRAERLTGGRRGGASDCLTIPALWLDIDIRSDAHASEQLPETLDDALALLDEFPLPATAVVDSGHGLQAWWQLTEPLAGDAATKLLADWGATWARLGDRHGWHVDNVFDLARVMRLPGTWNRKGKPKLVTIISENWERTYGVDDIDGHLIPAPAPVSPAATRRDLPYIGPERPGDAYNAVADPGSILERAGFHFDHSTPDGARHYRAPHRTKTTDTTGATVYSDGHTTLWSQTFARSTGMDVRRPYDAYGLYAHIEHRGDWRAATIALRAAGYGADVFDEWERSVPISGSATTREAAPQEAPPLPLGSPNRSGPTFPMDCLPTWIADQCAEVAHAFQVPVDLPAMLAIGALSTISTGRVRVNLTGSAWSEHVNLYLVSAMAPGTGKSPVYKVMMRPVGEIETESMRQAKAAIREAQARRQIAERKLAAASKDDSHEAARNIAAVLAELDELPTPPAGRLVVEDITPEALVEELAANAGRLAIMSSEGGVFDMMGGQYSERGKATNLSIYLQGWSGDSVRRKRTKGEESRIDEALLTVCVTTQPGVVASLGANKELTTKGVPVRFMFSVPPSLVGYRDRSRVFTTMSAEVADTYAETLLRIGKRLLANQHPTTLRLTSEAAASFVAWDQAIEERQRPGADLAERAEWAAKLRASVMRMAGLLHVADNAAAGERETFGEIGIATIARAIEIGGYWLAHADVVEKMWTDDQVNAKARTIVRWAIEHGPEFTLRDVFVAKRGSFPTAEEAVAPMQMLVDRGWISPLQDGPVMVGGRGVPSQRFELRADAAEHLNAVDVNLATQPAQPAQLVHREDADRVESDPACGKVARVEMVARKSGNKNYLPITPQLSTPESHAQPAQPAQLPTGTEAAPFRPF